MYFEIRVNEHPPTRTGADGHNSIVLKIRWNDGGELDAPLLWVDSFKFRGDDIETHHNWDIGHLRVGDEIRVRLLDKCDPDAPTMVDDKRPPFSKDEKIRMGRAIKNLEGVAAALENVDWERRRSRDDLLPLPGDETVCSFCRKSKEQVSGLVAGPSVAICDECVLLSAQLLTEPNTGS